MKLDLQIQSCDLACMPIPPRLHVQIPLILSLAAPHIFLFCPAMTSQRIEQLHPLSDKLSKMKSLH